MAPKREADSSDSSSLRKRKVITMKVKLDIINRHESGVTPMNIGRMLGLSRSTVATIIKNKDRIVEHVRESGTMKSSVIVKQRSGLIIEMEKQLMQWLKEQNELSVQVSLIMIQERAKELFETLKSQKCEGSENEEFMASRSWLVGFKARANLHNLKVQSETISANDKEADGFCKGLAQIIKVGDYCAEQVFNVDETGLFWKRMPNHACITKDESISQDFEASKERLSLLLGGNASGDFKLKPMLVYHNENPKALKGVWKSQLPVIWRSNKMAWVTTTLFKDWFMNHFVPEVERYCSSKALPFKVLLVLDNATSHPANLADFHSNVNVVYLPPNTTAMLQPMDQGIIASLKAHYLRKTMGMLFRTTESQKNMTIEHFWKTYDIRNAVKNIADAWDEVKQMHMNGAWSKICPQFVNDFHGFEETLDYAIKEIVSLSMRLGLVLDDDDVTDLLASHREELSAEDLIVIELENQIAEDDGNTLAPSPKIFTTSGLENSFTLLENAMADFEAQDSNMDRFTKVSRGVIDAVRCYWEILEEKRKLSFRDDLIQCFNKVERSTTTSDT